jgi:hypothetical protein
VKEFGRALGAVTALMLGMMGLITLGILLIKWGTWMWEVLL